jgi:periplasmic protein TonB
MSGRSERAVASPTAPSALLDRRPQRRRWLALVATLAIHAVLALGANAVSEYGSRRDRTATPTLELIDVEVPLPPPPPPTPEPEPEPEPMPTPVRPAPAPRPTPRAAARVATDVPPPVAEPPPSSAPAAPGGAPTVALPVAPPSARGVAVRQGAVAQRVGRGGDGGGEGAGSGAGAGAQPVSIAMIKTQAVPKGDYSYFDARKDYPAEALQLGIEGKIRVRLTVSAEGQVTAAVLLNKLGHGLDQVALTQARRLEFVPAKDDRDRAVASFVVWTFTFTLPTPP